MLTLLLAWVSWNGIWVLGASLVKPWRVTSRQLNQSSCGIADDGGFWSKLAMGKVTVNQQEDWSSQREVQRGYMDYHHQGWLTSASVISNWSTSGLRAQVWRAVGWLTSYWSWSYQKIEDIYCSLAKLTYIDTFDILSSALLMPVPQQPILTLKSNLDPIHCSLLLLEMLTDENNTENIEK